MQVEFSFLIVNWHFDYKVKLISNGFSEKYYTLSNQINKLQDSVRDKEIVLSKNKRLIEDKKYEINRLQEELDKVN